MLIGVIMAGIDQIVKLDGQIGTVIDTILLIARAVMAILYSRVIHSLQNDEADQYALYKKEGIDEIIAETVKQVVQEALTDIQQALVSQLEASLSQSIDERLMKLDAKQATAISETNETIMATLETALRKNMRERRQPTDTSAPSNVRYLTEAASRKTSSKGEREIDKVIWPLLNSGMTVHAIAKKANTSTATVGRSRKRWEGANSNMAVSQSSSNETTFETAARQAQQTTP